MERMILETISVILTGVHFGIPLLYYAYLKHMYLNKPWNVKQIKNYKRRVTIIVPTYNEAKLIREKLDNIAAQSYPRELFELIVIDSASSDGTPEIVKEWAKEHPEIELKLIQESVRQGMAYALNKALQVATGEVVVVTDADCKWLDKRTLEEVLSLLSDPSIGAVTCPKIPSSNGPIEIEKSYRDFYNVVRIAESKAWATPIFHGELAAFKKSLLEEVGGFPAFMGSGENYAATLIALKGYRAIAFEKIKCSEIIPKKDYHKWRIRRAQHLIQHFTKFIRYIGTAPERFRLILLANAYLHLVNPWLLVAAMVMLVYESVTVAPLAIALLLLGAFSLLCKPYRTWIAMQLYLVAAAVRNLWTKDILWEKQVK